MVDTKFDLYEALSVAKDATPAEIKAAYRRAALLSHPDKLPPASTPEVVDAANTKFQRVGLAYAVLKDDKRRERYDATGETEEGSGTRTEAEWKDYFRELWTGEVNAESIDEFKQKYQGSDEERDDLFAVYTSSKGDLDTILVSVMCSDIDDEDRFIALINAAIAAGTLSSTPAWKKALKDTKGKQKRRSKATKEAAEAEAYAKELGVHEKLYGDKSKGAKGKGKKASTSADGGEDDPDAGLRALIQGNQAKRMESMMESLEAKYGAAAMAEKENKKGKKKRRSSVIDELPSEDTFLAVQAQVEARRSGKKGESSSSEPGKKKAKKGNA